MFSILLFPLTFRCSLVYYADDTFVAGGETCEKAAKAEVTMVMRRIEESELEVASHKTETLFFMLEGRYLQRK